MSLIIKPPVTGDENLDKSNLTMYENMIRIEKLLLEIQAVVNAEHG